MSTIIFDSFKLNYARGTYDLSATDFYIALVTSDINDITNLRSKTNWSELSACEVSGDGYTAGGKLLSGKTVTLNSTTHKVKWDATDVTWNNSSITARGAVIYTSGTNDLVCFQDYGTDKTSDAGPFIHSFNVNGILNIS